MSSNNKTITRKKVLAALWARKDEIDALIRLSKPELGDSIVLGFSKTGRIEGVPRLAHAFNEDALLLPVSGYSEESREECRKAFPYIARCVRLTSLGFQLCQVQGFQGSPALAALRLTPARELLWADPLAELYPEG